MGRRAWALAVASATILVPGLLLGQPAVDRGPGGFLESATSTAVRPVLTTAQIQALLPARGVFTFPPPYGTQGIRLTNPKDCGGRDCVYPAGYSYWRNINNHTGSNTILIFLGLNRERGGTGPTLFGYDKSTGQVTNRGPIFGWSSPLGSASGEGWYFSASRPSTLYVNDGPRLLRYDVLTKKSETVFDLSTQRRRFGANRYIWQMHSSNDDRVHSATLRDGASYKELGCLAYREDTGEFSYFPQKGVHYDECQVDKSGRWLLIKEKLGVDPASEVDNRIIDLTTGAETDLLDRDGAGGHSDNGFGYMVAADNWDKRPNAIKLWKFGVSPLQGLLVYHNLDWNVQAPNHVSHANARPDVPAEQQYACGSSANRTNAPRANEIICFPLDGSLRVLVVAPVMATLSTTKGDDNYARLPKGNLDVSGQYFLWTSNMGGDRLDAFIVRVPAHLLGVSPRAGADRPGGQAARSSTLAGGAGATLSQVTR